MNTQNIYKVGNGLIAALGFITVLLLVLTVVPSAVSATTVQQIGTPQNAVFLGGIEKTASDSHGNSIAVIGNAYLLYNSNGEFTAIAYIFKEYVSPSSTDNSWMLRKADTTHPTTVITLENPISAGKSSEFILKTVTPQSIEEKESAGVVTYGFGISADEGYEAAGGHVDIHEYSYVTWTLPVFYYTYGPRYVVFDKVVWWGSITGDLQYSRHFTAAASVEYIGDGEQSVHYSFEGNYQKSVWYGTEYSSTSLSGDLTTYLYKGGGGGTPV